MSERVGEQNSNSCAAERGEMQGGEECEIQYTHAREKKLWL